MESLADMLVDADARSGVLEGLHVSVDVLLDVRLCVHDGECDTVFVMVGDGREAELLDSADIEADRVAVASDEAL